MNIYDPFLITFILGNVYLFFLSLFQAKFRNNPHGLTRILLPLGIFVWADGVVISIFWTIIGLYSLLFGSVSEFVVLYALFWVVRSFGEVIYWLLQQFSSEVKDPPETVPFSNIFPGKSVWFAMQVIWQMVLVISIFAVLQLVQ